MSKSDVNGELTNEVFKFLRLRSSLHDAQKGTTKEVPWNFTKFLVTADLSQVTFINPREEIGEIEPKVEAALTGTTETIY